MPRTGYFILHSSVTPQVTAGSYELLSEHSGVPFGVEPERTHVRVAAPRYVMPTDQILSSFPPANAEGAFGDRLPQIVLKRRTLPWERNPSGATTPDPNRPWLALVVVAEGEAELSKATPVRDCVTAGTVLLDADDKDVEQALYLAVTETVVKKIFPCEEDLALLTHVREVDVNDTELANGDDDGWLAVVLANRLPVFDQANGKPVRYMACLVNLEGQLAALPPPLPPVATFEFALAQDWTALASIQYSGDADVRVLGGSKLESLGLPHVSGITPRDRSAARTASVTGAAGARGKAGGASIDGAATMTALPAIKQWSSAGAQVAAVALDPDAKALVRDSMALGFRLPIELVALEKVFRFPVLAHWSFTTNEGATFETLMRDVDVGLLGSVVQVPENTPMAADQPEVVETGHIGLNHRTRRGDPLRAWYRGPCVPFPTPRDGDSSDAPLKLAHAADQLRRVIPDGREDLGLAAAFEIGRLLSLSQLSVVSALLRFRGEQFGAGRMRELLAEILPFELPKLETERIDMGRFVALRVVDMLAKQTKSMLGPRRPIADPGRPLPFSGNLDEVVAAGLGVDLGALRERSATVGIVAALGQTAVPVALKQGEAPNPKLILPALRGALQSELTRVLSVAAPTLQRSPRSPAIRGSAPRAHASTDDALDNLIARATDAGGDSEETP